MIRALGEPRLRANRNLRPALAGRRDHRGGPVAAVPAGPRSTRGVRGGQHSQGRVPKLRRPQDGRRHSLFCLRSPERGAHPSGATRPTRRRSQSLHIVRAQPTTTGPDDVRSVQAIQPTIPRPAQGGASRGRRLRRVRRERPQGNRDLLPCVSREDARSSATTEQVSRSAREPETSQADAPPGRRDSGASIGGCVDRLAGYELRRERVDDQSSRERCDLADEE